MEWLFLVHRVLSRNSRERVKVWRLTKKVGAELYRNSVYVLPYTGERLEDFQWLCQEINDSRGEASVFISKSPDDRENQTIKSLFDRAREADYAALIDRAERVSKRIGHANEEKRLSDDALKSFSKELSDLEKEISDIERIDFFRAPLKRKAQTMIDRVRTQLGSSGPSGTAIPPVRRYHSRNFRGKTWTTREHIHIDRLCSSWLIRRFIDPKARFVFAPQARLPAGAIPFDVFGVEFSHHGEECTFETLLRSFRIRDKGLGSLAEIIHDIDMKDGKYARPEAAGLDAVVRSLSDSLMDDRKVLEVGTVILDSLYTRLAGVKRKR